MLEEFIRDITAAIDKKVNDELTKLVAADGDCRSNLIRGNIRGLAEAKDIIEKTRKSYLGGDTDEQRVVVPPRVHSLRQHRAGGRA